MIQSNNKTNGFYAKKSFERKNTILKKAKKRLLSKGFYKSTMQDFAKDNNISRQMLYKYFPSFDHLVFEIQINDMKSFMNYLEAIVTKEGESSIEKLNELVDGILSYEEKHSEDFLFTQEFDVYYRLVKVKAELRNKYSATFKNNNFAILLTKLFQDGQNEGVIKTTFTPEQMAYSLSNFTQSTLERIAIMRANKSWNDSSTLYILKETYKDVILSNIK